MPTHLNRASARPVRLAAAFVIVFLLVVHKAAASERWATLEAIHQLENPGDKSTPGSLGELGAYQFREQTWKMHTQAPFSRALDRRSSDAVAVKHYEWIKSELERRGLAVTPYNVALAWNGGIRAVTDGHPPAVAVDYASRAANLAAEFDRSQVADSH
ncbi:MAG TPA: hypothetical protein VFE25_07060 [Opitutaceae bacterium]|nr:hypothetical protein [Opitutaceae bacterium]